MKIYIPFDRFRWTIHNVIAHPLYEVFAIFGLTKLANIIHDITIPPDS